MKKEYFTKSYEENDNSVGLDELEWGVEIAKDVSTKCKKSNYYNKMHGRKKDQQEKMHNKSKEYQKSRMKKEMIRYAQEKQAKQTANNTNKISKKLTDTAEDLIGKIAKWWTEFFKEHPMVLISLLLLILIIFVFGGILSSCSALAGGVQGLTVASSFTANDDQILAVEADYVALEVNFQNTIDSIETLYPGYDEYSYNLTEIGHNPYELAALLTVKHEAYTELVVLPVLQTILNYQYTLNTEEVVETRTRTKISWHYVTYYRDEERTGLRFEGGRVVPFTYTVKVPYQVYEPYEVEEEFEYKILKITLTNGGIEAAKNQMELSEDQAERYSLLIQTYGNKPDIFGDNPYARPSVSEDYRDYAIPGEYMTDIEFANIVNEAKKYLGYPYVWGGESPSTSFDCSGFVSYVINNCGNGWSYGRLTAEGWRNTTLNVLPEDVQPGDLVFFQGTYSTSGASHVGIVVDPVNKIMIHCGNPIQYASYDTPYWREHAYCYGRLP